MTYFEKWVYKIKKVGYYVKIDKTKFLWAYANTLM